ncbi:MAG: hypothetical protein MHM6MM_000943 [Cercozoa sp. M6MM]
MSAVSTSEASEPPCVVRERYFSQWSEKQAELKRELRIGDEHRGFLIEEDNGELNIVNLDVDESEPDLHNSENNSAKPLRYIGGVDISFALESDTTACAALVILEYPSLEVVYEDLRQVELQYPYIPGFLAFREVPFLLDLLDKLRLEKPELMPQVLFTDGNGVLHPRGFGLASQLGVQAQIPCIGIGKKFLDCDGLRRDAVRQLCRDSLQSHGDAVLLKGETRTVGAALLGAPKTKNPVFVSVGHRVSLYAALLLTLRMCRTRIPEPVRQADLRSRRFLRGLGLL